MTTNLVVVESPAKSKTITKYLGQDFFTLASYGHVRDLLPKSGSVEYDHDFVMHYDILTKNAKHIDAICKAAKKSKKIYLALDPDREGEAIAWHLYQILQDKGVLKNKEIQRIAFHEITQSAVQKALQNPRAIDMNLVNAQQARRALDYLVGFNLSPLLWKKIQRGLSAGRVQSPALRLIVERELAIEAFKSQEYWTIHAACDHEHQEFQAKLIEYDHKKLEPLGITQEKQASTIKQTLQTHAQGQLHVTKVEKKLRKRHPAPPFITSTLQQEASRKLGFSTRKTMMVAQYLYEGIDIGAGPVGLITYMRTDSVHLADSAVEDIRNYIVSHYGKENIPSKPRVFISKSKNAQEAHEAIRPTTITHAPESIRTSLTQDQYKLYTLIWKRTVACQMIHATLDTVAIDLGCGEGNTFRATGSTIKIPGFLTVYQEGHDDSAAPSDTEGVILPSMAEGDKIHLSDILCGQHFTEPPPRYTEASLVKTLEEYGIGRPSTYATIISTLQDRQYVTLEKKRFQPTDVGKIVAHFLTEYFSKYVDYHFTAQLEDELDDIARGEKAWIPVLKAFWTPFKNQVDTITTTVKKKDVASEQTDELCPLCQKPLIIRLGRNGRFIACSGYPECRYTRNLKSEETPADLSDRICPQCGASLQFKQSRFGKFLGCSKYPECKYTEPFVKPVDTGVSCPQCDTGTLMKRQSKKNKPFYACSRYPDCQYSVFNEPVAEPCPKCKWKILTLKYTKAHGQQKACPQKECDYVESIETD